MTQAATFRIFGGTAAGARFVETTESGAAVLGVAKADIGP
jgi:hypothetical protein